MCFTFDVILINYSATELGSYAAYANEYSSFEVICGTDFACSAQVMSMLHAGRAINIIHAADQVRRLQYTLATIVNSSQ